ncbi:HAD-IA family hydrolase [Tropicimonas sp. IMCC6043]|uniref:HAD-IA family hydrolase n=1 Tax=Tropicimonas sp. IMCC6043 TaxID=2510645 RepID=UPI00101D69A4|nr:HAD-IA family hydrolase [Tropicimonas sp. IMCC6043]RYH08961.1 HAD family hydrolase [Tropicimonas sp. IMCC6043]
MSDPTPLRLVVFDVDGTLVDSQAHILAAMARAFDGIGRPVPPRDEVLSIVGLSLAVAVARLAPDLDAESQAALVEGYKAGFADIRMSGAADEMSPLYPGALDALDGLLAREDLLLGIATGKSRRGLDHLLAAHRLTGRFATEQVADHHPSKPHPSMLLAALAETGVEARDGVMIGDTSYDMEMGRAAGLRTIGVSWGYHPARALLAAGAEIVIDGFDALDRALVQVWEG